MGNCAEGERIVIDTAKPRPDRRIRGRVYYDTTGRYWSACRGCEHCDSEHSAFVRNDMLRGLVCPVCDSALDEMLGEPDT